METLSRQTAERKMQDCDVLQESGLGTCHLCWGGLPGDAGAFELPLLFVSNPSPPTPVHNLSQNALVPQFGHWCNNNKAQN